MTLVVIKYINVTCSAILLPVLDILKSVTTVVGFYYGQNLNPKSDTLKVEDKKLNDQHNRICSMN